MAAGEEFKSGDRVRVKEGNFQDFEGVISSIDDATGFIEVQIDIFGRITPVEIHYEQHEKV
jgi:transcriptional antiterminator NusG